MADYIDREAFIGWLKTIPLKDLSDGLGLCRVIMEDDFKRCIKNIPKSTLVDAVPVVRCKDCEYWECGTDAKGEIYKKYLCDAFECGTTAYDFCSNGVSKMDAEEKR